VRSILDGHVVLTRELAHRAHYPAIDVLQSVSRLVGEVLTPDVRAAGQHVRELLAAYRDKEDLIAIGAYQSGTDPVVDRAIAARPDILAFLKQGAGEGAAAEAADARLRAIAGPAGLEGQSPQSRLEAGRDPDVPASAASVGLEGLSPESQGGAVALDPSPARPSALPPLGLSL
jgi:flagellum-specific ATP synthase